jgi:hypothetical protein
MHEENELLVWTSLERNESLPQTKLHYERDMLFIDSDIDEGDCADDDSGGSGSIEWGETLEWESEDERRMKQGVSFGPSGWWDPKQHKSAEERIEVERARKGKEMLESGKVKAKGEDGVTQARSPQNRRRRSSGYRSSGNTPNRRKSGGKRAFGAAGGS